MKEDFLHYVWKYKLFKKEHLVTTKKNDSSFKIGRS
jgi:hypothetical protein